MRYDLVMHDVWQDNSSVEATSCEFSFIWTGANCTATFVDCRIEGSCGCGLNVARNGDCRLMRCHVTANRGAGVWVSECGSVSAQECDVSDNGQVETNALGHSNLGGGFAGEAGSHIVLKGGAVTRNVGACCYGSARTCMSNPVPNKYAELLWLTLLSRCCLHRRRGVDEGARTPG